LTLLKNKIDTWAYVHIPKTGGTTIKNLLKEVDGNLSLQNHSPITSINNEDIFTFTFVRNPFTRFMSLYYHECRKVKDTIQLRKFVEDVTDNYFLYMPQSYYVNEDKSNLSFVGKYESFIDDLNFVLKQFNIQHKIPHLNRNPIYDKHPHLNSDKYYSQILSQEKWVVEWIRERYKDDFKIFNYGMELPR
tara:strand:+ start:1145 stop:1714 length:570 start_codon:yes stop_codon:yes gene_type:complete